MWPTEENNRLHFILNAAVLRPEGEPGISHHDFKMLIVYKALHGLTPDYFWFMNQEGSSDPLFPVCLESIHVYQRKLKLIICLVWLLCSVL